MGRLQQWLDKTDKFFNNVASFTLMVLMLWIVLDVFLRFGFNRPIPGTMEITGEYFMVIIVFLALSYTYKLGAHITIDIFSVKFPKLVQDLIKVVSNIFVIALMGYTFYVNLELAIENFQRNILTSSSLKYPMAPAYLILSFGFLLLSFRLVLETIATCWNVLKRPKEES